MIKEKKIHIYSCLVCSICFNIEIFKFILIYLLHVLLVFKIKDIFEKKILTKNMLK